MLQASKECALQLILCYPKKKVTQSPLELEEKWEWERNPLDLAKRYLSKKQLKY